MGILDTAPDVTLVVRHHQQRAQRAVPLDAEGHAGPLALQVIAHHGPRRQQTAQGRRGHRGSLVDLPGPLRQGPGRHRRRFYKAILGDGTYQLIAHI